MAQQAILAPSVPSAEERTKLVQQYLVANGDALALATAAVDESVLVATAKVVLAAMVEYAFQDDVDADTAVTICHSVVKATVRRSSAFGDEIVRAREVLADAYQISEQHQNALNALLGMPTDAGLRSATDEYKAALYVRVAELSLELDNTMQAETYVKRSWGLMRCVSDSELRLRFDTCHAEVCDVNRRFLEAGQRYYSLSHKLEEGLPALKKAIVCVLLEDAGPKRSHLISTIYRDERLPSCDELGAILAKVHHERVLREADITAIVPHLKPHHKALMRGGRTVFDNAMTQHNLLSASKLYYNISLTELGVLLGVDPSEAERIAAHMVKEDRLSASIDQVNEVINFHADARAAIDEWDGQIAAVCQSISLVSDEISRRYPEICASSSSPTNNNA